MNASTEHELQRLSAALDAPELPLFAPDHAERPIGFRNGAPVTLAHFQQDVERIAARLPASGYMVNLCEGRYRFVAAYAAAARRRQTVLLPPTRAEQVVSEVQARYPGAYRFTDADVDAALADAVVLAPDARATLPTTLPCEHVVMIGFTSGSTGEPKRFPKRWVAMHGSNHCNLAAMRTALGGAGQLWVLATVPSQHMYGMELSVIAPLIGGVAIHSARPLFPADVAQALAELPAPRVLVSTPVHLRAIVESQLDFPHTDLIVCATAPLDREVACAVEKKLGGRLLEMFGSTETCVFAARLTSTEEPWRLYPGVTLEPQPDGTLVNAPWFAEPVLLQDIVELHADRRFSVRGRNTDMIEVAGKRASLSELTRRLLAVEGVRDAFVFQPEAAAAGAVRRVAAVVVAPGLTSLEITRRLALSVDSAFLPRPLVIVDSLPRNEVGKLPRERLMELLRGS